MIKCPKCGTRNLDEDEVCSLCGMHLKGMMRRKYRKKEVESGFDNIQMEKENQASEPLEQYSSAFVEADLEGSAATKRAGIRRPLVITIVALVAVSLIAGLIYMGSIAVTTVSALVGTTIHVTYVPTGVRGASRVQLNEAAAVLKKRLNKHVKDGKYTIQFVNVDGKMQSIQVGFVVHASGIDKSAVAKELGAEDKLIFKAPDGRTILTGSDIHSAAATVDMNNNGKGYEVSIQFTPSGTKKFSVATKKYINQAITAYYNNKVIISATIPEQITSGTVVIDNTSDPLTLDFTQSIADALNAGQLPFPLKAQKVV